MKAFRKSGRRTAWVVISAAALRARAGQRVDFSPGRVTVGRLASTRLGGSACQPADNAQGSQNRRRRLLVFSAGCGSRCSALEHRRGLIEAREWIVMLFYDSFRARGPGTGQLGAALLRRPVEEGQQGGLRLALVWA